MLNSCRASPYTSYYLYFPDTMRKLLIMIYYKYILPLEDYLDKSVPGYNVRIKIYFLAEPINDVIEDGLYILLYYSNVIKIQDPILLAHSAIRLGKFYSEKNNIKSAVQV